MTKREIERFNVLTQELETVLQLDCESASLDDQYDRFRVAQVLAKWATLRIQEEIEHDRTLATVRELTGD